MTPARPPEPNPPAQPARVGITRLAPSPTGALHLGNARTFLVNWALARTRGWQIVLRLEDLDGPRVKPDAARAAVDTLAWLGIDWDVGPVCQSADLEPYRLAMDVLARSGRAYACAATRGEIDAAASAPQEGVSESCFPSSLRPAFGPGPFEEAAGMNWRFVTPPGQVAFVDEFAGDQRHEPARTVGDFVIWTRRGQPAYQLAVVVDDHRQGVTHVVRGDDLLDSTARQLLLYRALGLTPEPAYLHLPLVRGPDGRRLAKRHGDTRIDSYRSRGVSPERIIALLARWCGAPDGAPGRGRMSAGEFRSALDLRTMPRGPVTFGPEDDRWLLSECSGC